MRCQLIKVGKMYTIENNNISLTRGDTLIVQVNIKQDGSDYIPDSGDIIYFALKHNTMDSKRERYLDKEPLILKMIPNDTLILRLESAETKNLAFGRYVYEIELTKEDGTVDTFISGIFTLTPEVN